MLKKLSLSLAALFLAATALRADIVDEIIARVNTAIITRADYERAKQTTQNELEQQSPGDWQAKWPDRQKEILRELIDQQLLLEKGKELGITGETDVIKRLNQMRQQMGLASIDDLEKEAQKQGVSFEDFKEQIRIGAVTQQVIGQEVGSKLGSQINNEDIKDWYDKHQKELEGPEEIALSEIMVSTQTPKAEDKDKQQDAVQEQPIVDDPAKVAPAEAKD